MKQYVKISVIAIVMFLLILGMVAVCAVIGGETISWAWVWDMAKIELLACVLGIMLIGAASVAVKWLMSE